MQKEYSGGAPTLTLSAALLSNATFSFSSREVATGYPEGDPLPFVVTLARGTDKEEKILVTFRVDKTFYINQRGYDDTTAVLHQAGTEINHMIDAASIREANEHVHSTTGVHGIENAEMLISAGDWRLLSEPTVATGPLGTIIAKMPVYDNDSATPSIIGWMPIYNTID